MVALVSIDTAEFFQLINLSVNSSSCPLSTQFLQKKVKIWKFYTHKSYIPQNEAKNVYDADLKRKSFIFVGKKIFLDIFDFFSKGGTLLSKIIFISFTKISKKISQNEVSRTIQT